MIIAAVTLLLGYLLIYGLNYGIPPSMSHTAKAWENWATFPIILGLFLTLMFASGQPLIMTLGIMALSFVAGASKFWDKVQHKWHFGGAFGGFGLMVVSVVFEFGQWPMALGAIVVALPFVLFNIKNKTLWLELIGFGLALLSLIGIAVYLLRNIENSTWWREIAIILIIYGFLMTI